MRYIPENNSKNQNKRTKKSASLRTLFLRHEKTKIRNPIVTLRGNEVNSALLPSIFEQDSGIKGFQKILPIHKSFNLVLPLLPK